MQTLTLEVGMNTDFHKAASSIRPALTHRQAATDAPASPHTPRQVISSTFSSPAASYRAEEDHLVFEFGSRYLRAGFANESAPRCTLGFGPNESRRAGDDRQWLPEYEDRPPRRTLFENWGRDHELWQMDLREVDLGLVEDKIERAVREAYSKYLLLETKTKRILLVIPATLAHPLLSTLLTTLFSNFQNPTITLLSGSSMTLLASGLRSGLVVDIGWHETVITSIYEYREIDRHRTVRAMQQVSQEMVQGLQRLEDCFNKVTPSSDDKEPQNIEFEHAEDIMTRLAWCNSSKKPSKNSCLDWEVDRLTVSKGMLHEDQRESSRNDEKLVNLPLQLPSSRQREVSISVFQEPIEKILLAKDEDSHSLDDHEWSIPHLIYMSLLSLSPDIRGLCMSRIIFVGGGSRVPGLKSRLLGEVSALVDRHGWNPVRGKAADEYRRRLEEIAKSRQAAALAHNVPPEMTRHDGAVAEPKDTQKIAAALIPQTPDPIESKLRHDEAKSGKPMVSGVIRGVESLGAWAGASLLGAMRVKGIVEIDRETFLQYGLAGAKRVGDVSDVAPHQAFRHGLFRTVAPIEKVGWTLGVWA